MKRQLASILYADVAEYSRLTGLDEEQTHQELNAGLNLLSDKIAGHGGQKVHEAGDAILGEFMSVTDAVEAAFDFQREMSALNAGIETSQRLEFRIGINLGEVIHDRGDIYGDGVNLAARVQALAEPGGLCVTGSVYELLSDKSNHGFDDLGYRRFKNIAQSVRVYSLKIDENASAAGRGIFFEHLEDPRPLVTGGCLCGEVRFEIRGKDIGSSFCHCRMCQRFSGAPLSAGTGFLLDDFRVTQGEPKIYQSSVIAERVFCPNCGSSLWMRFFEWKWIFVKTANLDRPEDFAPTTHFGVESRIPWHDVHDELPRLRCEDSRELSELWESAGVKASDPPRNTRIGKKPGSPSA